MTEVLLLIFTAVFALTVGFGLGVNARRRLPLPKPPPAICGCKHHVAFHVRKDGEYGPCQYSHVSDFGRVLVQCTCQGYMGPIPLPEVIP